MKTLTRTIILAALFASAMPALAETAASPGDTFLAEQKLTEYLAKDRLLGAKVVGPEGKIIGDIEDLIINSDREVVGAIMGVGGFLGFGEKKVAVSLKALSIEVTDGKMNVVMPVANKDVLAAAPAYKRVNPPKGWIQKATEKAQELKDKSSATAKDAVDAAKEKAGPAIEKAKEKAGEAYDKAKDAAGAAADKAQEAAKAAADKASEAAEKAKDAAKAAIDKAKDAAKPAEAPKP